MALAKLLTLSICLSLVFFTAFTTNSRAPKPLLASQDAWNAKITEAAEEDEVYVNKTTGPTWAKSPANYKWLYLNVELKAPKSGTALSVKKIKLVTASTDVYPLLGITQKVPKYFTLFEDMNGPGGVIGTTWAISEKNGEIIFEQAAPDTPAEVFLLFAVPINASNLNLQINDSPRIPVRIGKVS